MLKKIFFSFIFLIYNSNLFAQNTGYYLKANTGLHVNYSANTSIRITGQGVGQYFAGDNMIPSTSLHYDIGMGYLTKQNIFIEITAGKYNLLHTHDFRRIFGDVAPKIKLKQTFYQAVFNAGYNFTVPKTNFFVTGYLGVRFIRGKSRRRPDFLSSANGRILPYEGYSGTFDSAKVGIVINNTNLAGFNLMSGLNVGYQVNKNLAVSLGLFAETGLNSLITTGAIVFEYGTDETGQVITRTHPQTSISNGQSWGMNIGIKYQLSKQKK